MYFIFILIILLIIWYYSEFNTKTVANFNVHNQFDPYSSAAVLKEINERILRLQNYMKRKYLIESTNTGYEEFQMDERTKQFIRNYNANSLHEISPHNIFGSTSFTENKGKKIVFCLRDKQGNLHDINTLMFVALHEVTHVMNDRWGHEQYFWRLFKVVLIDAEEAGVYKPINYGAFPKSYCGMKITQNPYF